MILCLTPLLNVHFLSSGAKKLSAYNDDVSELNTIMLLHVHREIADTLDINILVNDFVTGSNNRKEIYA